MNTVCSPLRVSDCLLGYADSNGMVLAPGHDVMAPSLNTLTVENSPRLLRNLGRPDSITSQIEIGCWHG